MGRSNGGGGTGELGFCSVFVFAAVGSCELRVGARCSFGLARDESWRQLATASCPLLCTIVHGSNQEENQNEAARRESPSEATWPAPSAPMRSRSSPGCPRSTHPKFQRPNMTCIACTRDVPELHKRPRTAMRASACPWCVAGQPTTPYTRAQSKLLVETPRARGHTRPLQGHTLRSVTTNCRTAATASGALLARVLCPFTGPIPSAASCRSLAL